MSDSQPHDHGAVGSRRRGAFVLVPAATFLLGLLLGAALVWVAGPNGSSPDDGSQAQPSPTASPTPTPTSAQEDLVIPAACVRAVESAREVVDLLGKAVDALGDLDTQRLLDQLDRLEALDREIRKDAESCRPRPAGTPTTDESP